MKKALLQKPKDQGIYSVEKGCVQDLTITATTIDIAVPQRRA
jgi:hypothetical protein